MKIDLYNNHDTYIKERKQDWTIGRWLRSRGIVVADLEKHPRIQDIILLLNIKESMWSTMNNSEQGVWSAYWDIVYYKRRALKPKALEKFENITIEVINRQQLIQSLRTGTRHPNMDHDITAKGSCPPLVKHTAVEQGECRGDLAPWE